MWLAEVSGDALRTGDKGLSHQNELTIDFLCVACRE